MVWWGDEYGEKPSMSGVLVRTATAFTHTYEYPGTYTITVRLMLANGTMSERYTTVVVREPDMTPYTQSYTPTYVSTPYYVPQYTTQTYYAPTPTATYATYPTYESNYYTHHYWYSDGHDEEDTEDGGAPYYYPNTYVKPATIYTEPPATWSSWWYGEWRE
jgi:hypothetical protein